MLKDKIMREDGPQLQGFSICRVTYVLSFLCLLLLFALSGCASVGKTKAEEYKYLSPGDLATAKEGERFFSYGFDAYSENKSSLNPFEVSVLRLNERELILKLVFYEGGKKRGSWTPLPGVKTYTYPITIDTIRLMDFNFIILSYEEGRLRYKRIK